MNKILIITIGCLLSFSSVAQKYGTALGLRMGDKRYGLSVRQQFLPKLTGELLMEVEPQAFQASFLPKFHVPLIGKSLNWYIGAGAHVGQLKDFGFTYGFDLMTGVEWKLPALPLTLSVDVKPAYNLQDQDWFEFPAAISVHYIIAKETKAKRKKARKKRKKRKERKERREDRRAARSEWWQDTFAKQDKD